jgi:hypothetical protein
MLFCQYEGATTPAKPFSKFTQNNKKLAYILFEAKFAINSSHNTSFTMHPGKSSRLIELNHLSISSNEHLFLPDVSHMSRTPDL